MFTIGTDPEVLFSNGMEFKSAIGLLPGTKENPAKTRHGYVQVDNVAGEFNTNPTKAYEEFDQQIDLLLNEVQEMVKQHGLVITQSSVGEYSEEELSHPNARVGGCDPDYNAYTESRNPVPPMEYTNLRAAGGHVHIGYKLSREDISSFIKTLDLLITIPMLKHENPDRRKLYGKAGAFRFKSYGVEYRTPSNFWIFTAERRKWLFDRVADAINVFKNIQLPERLDQIINDHDLETAEELVQQYNLVEIPA